MSLAWGNKVSSDFRDRVFNIVGRFNWTPDHANWLMAAMAFESGETFSPRIRNGAGSGAVGLIQFMPATAAYLGTTPADLTLMTAEDQLEFVYKYFKPYARRVSSLPDMYMSILLPKYVGQPDDSVLFQGGVGYRQNAGLDLDHDGKVTKKEAASKVFEKLAKGMLKGYVYPS